MCHRPASKAIRIAALLLAATAPMLAAEVALSGRVVDENDAPVRDAHVTLHAGAGSWDAITGSNGAFSIALPQPGDFAISVTRQGYYPLQRDLHLDTSRELTL